MIISCIKSAELALEIISKEYERTKDDNLFQEKQKLEQVIYEYKNIFSQLPETENRLYYKIKYEGKNVNKAIDEVCDENYMNDIKPCSRTQMYDSIYKKIRKYL